MLDEADVFVEKRAKVEILRNSMVGVFLRLTEYYLGILFFTSNRVTPFDPAFLSRVTVTLRYFELDLAGRRDVWKNLLEKSGVAVRSGFNLDKLASYVTNGRQSKNTLQLALVLAKHRGKDLTEQSVLDFLEITSKFRSHTHHDSWNEEAKKTL